MYLVDSYIPTDLKNAIDFDLFFLFESVHGEAMLKTGWVVKKCNVTF